MHPPDVRITNPVSSQDVRVVYRPLIRQKNVELLEGFIHFPVSFARLFLLAIVTCVALVVLHNQIRRDLRRLHQTSTNVLWLFGSLCLVNPPSLRHLSSSLFLHWIMFIACFRLISFVYSGAVSTRLVLLDTHDLMHSLDQIVNSGRRPCWMKEEKYLNDFSQRPKQSQYRQLWDNQAKNRCWLEKSANLWSITDNLSKICGIAYSWYM